MLGRINKLGLAHWTIDLQSRSSGILNFSSIESGELGRRRFLSVDRQRMRKILPMGAILICGIQQIDRNSMCTLHMRSEPYGKGVYGLIIPSKVGLSRPKVQTICLNDLTNNHPSLDLSRGSIKVMTCQNRKVWIGSVSQSAVLDLQSMCEEKLRLLLIMAYIAHTSHKDGSFSLPVNLKDL